LQAAKEKEKFFPSVAVSFVNKLESHFEFERTLHCLVKKSMVEVIIGVIGGFAISSR
jgi:hypothetical protein